MAVGLPYRFNSKRAGPTANTVRSFHPPLFNCVFSNWDHHRTPLPLPLRLNGVCKSLRRSIFNLLTVFRLPGFRYQLQHRQRSIWWWIQVRATYLIPSRSPRCPGLFSSGRRFRACLDPEKKHARRECRMKTTIGESTWRALRRLGAGKLSQKIDRRNSKTPPVDPGPCNGQNCQASVKFLQQAITRPPTPKSSRRELFQKIRMISRVSRSPVLARFPGVRG